MWLRAHDGMALCRPPASNRPYAFSLREPPARRFRVKGAQLLKDRYEQLLFAHALEVFVRLDAKEFVELGVNVGGKGSLFVHRTTNPREDL